MQTSLPITKKAEAETWLATTARFLLLTLLFAVSYAQSPLYTSNQNQYFLHGLAHAGRGFLDQDWLANTPDPTPVFSLLVSLFYRLFHLEALFYVLYALLMGIYLCSVIGIIASLYPIRRSPAHYLAFLALFIAIHSAGLRFALSRVLGPNWTYVLEDGVADQRLLGPVFQPSAFGVLLMLSIYLFLKGRPYLAVAAAGLAATFHPTYLLSAALLTAAYCLVILFQERGSLARRLAKPVGVGLAALAVVAPILIYVYTTFGSTPPETTARAQEILVHFRIPHHALIGWWFDATAVFKIILVCAALFLVRRTRLFPVMLLASLVAAGLTLLQALLQSNTLALIFPWRISTVLVPLSSGILLAWGVSGLLDRRPQHAARYSRAIAVAGQGIILLAVVTGGARFVLDLQRQAAYPERPMLAYLAGHKTRGEVYLTPVKMQDFRLVTGAPVYVEFKSIPYQDSDVLEWRRRIQLADSFYKTGDCQVLAGLAAHEGVTHVVLPQAQFGLDCNLQPPVYRDSSFAVHPLSRP